MYIQTFFIKKFVIFNYLKRSRNEIFGFQKMLHFAFKMLFLNFIFCDFYMSKLRHVMNFTFFFFFEK